MMKVLVMRLSSLGDVLLTTPVVRCLKRQLPDAEIHFLTKSAPAELLRYNPYVDKMIEYQDDGATASSLAAEHYDAVVDLHNNHHTKKIRQVLGGRTLVYRKENGRKFLSVLLRCDLMSGRHVVDRYLSAVEPLGVRYDGQGLDLFVDDGEAFASMKSPYVVIACGAQHRTKRIPDSRIAWLAAQTQGTVVLIGDKGDAERLEDGSAHLTDNVLNLCGKTTLLESASVIREAAVVVSGDSSMMHVASALHRPILAVWGATIPSFGFSPFCTEHTDYQVGNLCCRPCSRMGGERCLRGSMPCMARQDWTAIADKMNYYLNHTVDL